MRATITRDGYLHVGADTELEAYALRKWSEETVATADNSRLIARMVIDTSVPNESNEDRF